MGMKGKLVEEEGKLEEVEKEARLGRRVSFQLGQGVEEGLAEALKDPWEELEPARTSPRPNRIVSLVEHEQEAPQEEYEIAGKEDMVKMKELGLPLGFMNVSPYEVEEGGGVVETAVKERLAKGKRRGRKKKRRVVEEEVRAEFDSSWWAEQGQDRIMEVWRERYGKFMDGQEEQEQEGAEGEKEQTWKEYDKEKEEDKSDTVTEEVGDKRDDSVGGWGAAPSHESGGGAGGEGWGAAPPSSGGGMSGWGEVAEKVVQTGEGGVEAGGWGQGVQQSQGGGLSESITI